MPATDEYLESKVLTATPHQLHLMVIDGAIRHASAAETALQARDIAKAQRSLARAQEFLAEMIAGLNAKELPELVDQLKSLFVFIQTSLAEADRRHNPQRAADAVNLLRQYRGTWIALGEKLSHEMATVQPRSEAGFSWTS